MVHTDAVIYILKLVIGPGTDHQDPGRVPQWLDAGGRPVLQDCYKTRRDSVARGEMKPGLDASKSCNSMTLQNRKIRAATAATFIANWCRADAAGSGPEAPGAMPSVAAAPFGALFPGNATRLAGPAARQHLL
jgi:hypothetical protein